VIWETGEMHTGSWWGNLRGREHLEDAGVDGRIILKCIFRKSDGGMDWIDLAEDSDMWRVVAKAMEMWGGGIIFLTS